MRFLVLVIGLGLVVAPASAQQKTTKASKAKTCTYEQCVATNTGKGWSSSQVSGWCSANAGKCQ
ncbi:hypothetical protein NLM31_21940 [Bradyrhizobium sp. CCGUVB4N]|uniref:hypothetical protein n=1 Tax=Bradyrhizobium sp. CCGUVB4N TaxID=2949631 RepID=UPI0020B3A720|nr:hypothetical protein [Bradyrhizobium sp. CCGUVB4N]MCP3383033.1 hypothetical protein [Bradyrhizobium sp. CCGUVB4N]